MIQNRLKSIDVAKGICILIVLILHAIGQYGKSGFWGETGMNMYKLSLFFFVSGMFFSSTDSIKTFIQKKIEKLLVPFLFFYILTVIISPTIFYYWGGFRFNSFFGISLYDFFIQPFISEVSANGPLWFLWCLLLMNMYYLIITKIALKFSSFDNIKYYLSFLVGGIGIFLAYKGINLPANIDSAMSALPFFSLGDLAFRNSDILNESKCHNNKFIFFSICILFIINIFAYPVDYRSNTFEGLGYVLAYPFGIIGTISVITISKKLSHCKFLNYCGRFSLVILCTHIQIQQIIGFSITYRLHLYGWKGIIVNTILTIPICLIICQLLRNYFPTLIGLKRVQKSKV